MRKSVLCRFVVLLSLAATACQPAAPAAPSKPAPAAPAPAAPAPAAPAASPAATSTAVAPPKPVAAAPTATPAAADVPRGGTLVTALNADPDTINSSLNFGTTSVVGCKIQEGLLSVNDTRTTFTPELAESWTFTPDGLSYTFKLRQGVVFHDGTPFTSADVKWSFENVNQYHPITRRWWTSLQAIETPDPQTVTIKLKDSFAPLLASLSCADGGAITAKSMAPASGEARADQKVNQAPIGTGPFMIKERVAGDRIVLAKNDKYWKQNLPYLDQIVIRMVPDTTSMVLALRGGELNYIDQLFVEKEDIIRYRSDPNVQVLTGGDVPTFQMVMLNHRKAPLDKVEVRRALYRAVDQQIMLNNVYRGLGDLQVNMIDHRLAVATAPDINLAQMYPFDVAAANKLLDDAGVPRQGDGTRFQMRLIYESARSEWKEVAEVLRANWEPLGVRLVIEPAERAVMLDKVFKKRDFDMTLQSYTSSGDPALGVTRAYACEGDENPPNFGNPTGYCNKELDKLFTDAAKEPDFEKRRAIYRQAQKILAEELPIVVFMGDTDAGLGDKKFNFAPAVASYSRATKWESVHRLP